MRSFHVIWTIAFNFKESLRIKKKTFRPARVQSRGTIVNMLAHLATLDFLTPSEIELNNGKFLQEGQPKVYEGSMRNKCCLEGRDHRARISV